ncbi:MAG: hypothetical protein HOV94_16900 [Saccharothrix sp.]|nr:hypothetical protein [Saccharothrix sp.]
MGEPEPGLVDALLVVAAFNRAHATRGYHRCELCPRDGAAVDPRDFPAVGTRVEAVVAGHAEQGREIVLRVGP